MAHIQIFLSAVTKEFRSYRNALRQDLDRPNVSVKVQEDFIAFGAATLDKLDEYIRHCDVVIHLVGDMTGARATVKVVEAIQQHYPDLGERVPVLRPFLNSGGSDLYYTQWEAWLALYHEKALIIAVPHDGAPRDPGYIFDSVQRAAQTAHLERLASVGRYPEICFTNTDRLSVDVLRSKLQDILSQSPRPAGLWNVPDLPPNFVPRSGELEAVMALIQDPANNPVGVTGSALKIGLFGMGGIGKSVLAAAVARNEAHIRPAFPDGIIWLTFGLQAEPAEKQRELFRALNEPVPVFQTWEDGRAELGCITRVRRCLIILDDVWDPMQAQAFTQLGKDCRVLVTTRNANVLTKIGAALHSVDILLLDTAWREFLPKMSGDPNPPLAARDVAQACGCLPLALALVGALIRDRLYTWEEARAALEASRLEELSAELPNYEHGSVYDAIHLSVQGLDEQEREALLRCAVFQEDVNVPTATLETLWIGCLLDSDVVKARRILQRLVERSLLSRTNEAGDHYRFHDLIHHYLVARATQANQLAMRHRQLVEAYRSRCPSGWSSGPADGYYFQSLAYHLQQSGKIETLRDLLLDYQWLWRKGEIMDVASVMTDYTRFAEDDDVHLLHRALRLSAATLQADWTQLPSQLLGRLLSYPGHLRLQATLQQAAAARHGPWLRPLKATLQPPGGPLVQDLFGHTDKIHAVTLTGDGRYAISSSKDRTIKIWDLSAGTCNHTLEGHTQDITAVALTADSRRAVSASWDGILKVWDLASGTCVYTLRAHSSPVLAVASTPDARHAVSASVDKTLKIWDLASGVCVHTMAGHTGIINAIALTGDSSRALSGSMDQTLKIWDLASGTCSRTLRGHTEEVRAIVLTPDNRRVVSASGDRTLKVWDLDSGTCIYTLTGHSASIIAVALTPDGCRAVSASGDRTLKVWDLD